MTTATAATIDQLAGEYLDDLNERGARWTAEHWSTPIVDAWAGMLATGEPLDTDTANRTIAVMHESLALRDAILVASLAPGLGAADLHRLATRPHEPATLKLMATTLTAMYTDPGYTPDRTRARRAVDALTDLADIAGTRGAQPLAAAAYIEWWTGDPEHADRLALRSIVIDERCGLAAIVIGVLKSRTYPAYRSK